MSQTELWLQQMGEWILNPNLSGMYGRWNAKDASQCTQGGYGTPGEGGVDLPSPGGTPVYALGSGPVLGAGTWTSAAGLTSGIVTIGTQVPGVSGTQQMYYQHINIDPSIQKGGTVQAGQKIGTVMNQTGEVEVGYNAVWGGPWGTNKDCSKWTTDPRPWIAALMLNAPVSSGSQAQSAVASNIQQSSSFNATANSATCAPWNIPCIVGNAISALGSTVHNVLIRIGFFILGILLFIAGGILLISHDAVKLAKDVVPGAGEV